MSQELINQHEPEFARFYELYEAYNAHTNISAIREKNDVYSKHFLDSLVSLPWVQKYLESTKSIKLLDIGTGGGFPAVPLAIVLRNKPVEILALDSVGKKTKFVESVKQELALENLEVVKSRAEDLKGRHFDIVLSRAVAMLAETLVYTAPLLVKGGLYIAYKKSDIADEIQLATRVAAKLKLELIEQFSYGDKQLLIYKKH